MSKPTITQADRDAAATLAAHGAPGLGNGNKVVAAEIKGGLHDDFLIVQAFARHREAATLEGIRIGLEAAAKVAEANGLRMSIADPVRALDPAAILAEKQP